VGVVSRRRPSELLGVGLVLVALLAGCGDDAGSDEADGSTTTSTASTTTSTTADDAETAERHAVIDAYNAASEAAIAASASPTPNPDDPDLVATHTGPMLEQRRETFLGLRSNGWAIRYPQGSKYRVEVESVEFQSDNVAILEVCVVDDGERFVVETGEVIASGLGTVEWSAAMRLVDGSWKLAERREENRWDGEAGCAVD
jgi:hypothetical protein